MDTRKAMQRIQLGCRLIQKFKTWPSLLYAWYGLHKSPITLELRNGLKLYAGYEHGDINRITEIFLHRSYIRHLKWKVETVIDIGGNMGYFSIFAAYEFPDAKVYCFEPCPNSCDHIEKHIKINELKNVTVDDFAVSDKYGTAKLNIAKSSGEHSLVAVKDTSDTLDVKTITFDQIMLKYGLTGCDLLKMDCEGSEYDIIYGMSLGTLSKIKQIAMETHFVDNATRNEEALQRYLQDHGFYVIREYVGTGPFIYAMKR